RGGFTAYALLLLSVIVVAAGFLLAWLMYMTRAVAPNAIGRPKTRLHTLLLNAYYVDRIYDALIVRPLYAFSVFLARAVHLAVPLYLAFDGSRADPQFEERAAWMPTLGVSYHIGVDGISLLLVLLTAFLSPLALASAWRAVEERTKEFGIAMLILETGMIGVFVSLDLFLFYVF